MQFQVLKQKDFSYALSKDLFLDTGAGWYQLIYDLFYDIDQHLRTKDKHGFSVIQVKEKFGELRVYSTGYDDKILNLITEACDKSSQICDICGEKGQIQVISHVMQTVCDMHYLKLSKSNG